jgi:hypothetical protein
MNDYVIGAGAILTAGPNATISSACLHAQTEAPIAAGVRAALVDFEATRLEDLSRVVIVAPGWNRSRFEREVAGPLLARSEVTLAEVLATLAGAAGSREVHVFARWLPDESLCAALAACGISLVTHPLEAIARAALVSGQSYQRWRAPLRAA